MQEPLSRCTLSTALVTIEECQRAKAALAPKDSDVMSEENEYTPKGCYRYNSLWFFNTLEAKARVEKETKTKPMTESEQEAQAQAEMEAQAKAEESQAKAQSSQPVCRAETGEPKGVGVRMWRVHFLLHLVLQMRSKPMSIFIHTTLGSQNYDVAFG